MPVQTRRIDAAGTPLPRYVLEDAPDALVAWTQRLYP
jgi:hypothetical protein